MPRRRVNTPHVCAAGGANVVSPAGLEPEETVSIGAHNLGVQFPLVNLGAALLLITAAVLVLGDITYQAQLTKVRIQLDPDEDIAAASQYRRSGARRGPQRSQQHALEARFRDDPQRWLRYTSAQSQIAAWNWIGVLCAMTLIAAMVWFIDAYPG